MNKTTEYQRWYHQIVKPERVENDEQANLKQLKTMKNIIKHYIELYNQEVRERNSYISNLYEELREYRREVKEQLNEKYQMFKVELNMRSDPVDYPDELEEIELIDKN